MATSTELLRAAEHMRQHGERLLENEQWHAGTSHCEAADELEAEAKRIQAVEAKQSKAYCSDAVGRYDGAEILVEETPEAYAMRFRANPDNSLHLGKNCTVVTSERFLLGMCREVIARRR